MIYDYHCEKCGYEFEENNQIADRDIPTERPCTQCEAHSVKRGIAAPYMSYAGAKTLEQRARQGAGSDFVNRMEQIQRAHPNKLQDGTKKTVGGF